MRAVTEADAGLKVLVEHGAEDIVECAIQLLCRRSIANGNSILAVHGRGAHPDDTWCALRQD